MITNKKDPLPGIWPPRQQKWSVSSLCLSKLETRNGTRTSKEQGDPVQILYYYKSMFVNGVQCESWSENQCAAPIHHLTNTIDCIISLCKPQPSSNGESSWSARLQFKQQRSDNASNERVMQASLHARVMLDGKKNIHVSCVLQLSCAQPLAVT